MAQERPLNGWLLIVNTLFLGPVYLCLHLWPARKRYAFTKYIVWLPLLLLFIFSSLAFTLSYNPYLIRWIYLFLLLVTTGLIFAGCWTIDSKSIVRKRRPRNQMQLSRALAWMLFIGVLFLGLANLSKTAYFWLLGEHITVYFSKQRDIFFVWLPIGSLYGFIYGLFDYNTYIYRDVRSLFRSTLLLFLQIALFSLLALILTTFPLQRLAPVSYSPQLPDFIFYGLLVMAIPIFIIFFMKTASTSGLIKTLVAMPVAILLVMLHCIVLSGYMVTTNLTIASILEDGHRLDSAKKLYGKCIPYIKHDNLLAALHHRQGVLNVMNQDYEGALQAFKKVIADYSDYYEVYDKARQYIASHDKTPVDTNSKRKIINVRHQTFEQAASCFPNSLSVILNIYEEQPISTRHLSYSIKEGFDQGTFIWKAESFLEKHGYRLITSFWQDKETLTSLLDAGYPVLIYIPGHVYTLYGYDAKMEMFFTYDTAKSNRWNDNPFHDLLKTWMDSSFLMSVVVKETEERAFAEAFPELTRYASAHQLWQKTKISRFYESKASYWHDFDPYQISESLGLDRLKINDPKFLNLAYTPLAWDQIIWEKDMVPAWQRPWSVRWDIFQQHILYLLSHKQVDQAQNLIQLYRPHFNKEYQPAYAPFFELELAVAMSAGNNELLDSLSDNLIGINEDDWSRSYWGHYVKTSRMIEKGNIKEALQLMLPVVHHTNLDADEDDSDLQALLTLFDATGKRYPEMLDNESKSLLQIIRIHLRALNAERH